MAGRSTAGSNYQQCSREEHREIHDTNGREILHVVDRVAALENDVQTWAILMIYLECCIGPHCGARCSTMTSRELYRHHDL